MKYTHICAGKFIRRCNRFIALCEAEGKPELCHVKNTGRLAELLVPGAQVFLQKAPGGQMRKTKYDLISVCKGKTLVNIDSQCPNQVVREALIQRTLVLDGYESYTGLFAEKRYGQSRFDLCLQSPQRTAYIEIKGVTLQKGDGAYFPDAPSLRAVKHIHHLQQAAAQGYDAILFFLIQMQGCRFFSPNVQTQPAFSAALTEAEKHGVKILCYDTVVSPDCIVLGCRRDIVL